MGGDALTVMIVAMVLIWGGFAASLGWAYIVGRRRRG